MMDWLAQHGPMIVMILFMTIFVGAGVWAFRPSNKQRFDRDANIPFEERPKGE